ncbi:hypothetical protein F0562_025587 [Nyssa sinensis]|uniref:Uncharacterized protein n=1 Tax=Nyssa sinensis TaxID=561372 RepID=A0A5J5B6Q9_9ASTE|nr:hypothetical protein F0562_025587 [Nyssa sinensis]
MSGTTKDVPVVVAAEAPRGREPGRGGKKTREQSRFREDQAALEGRVSLMENVIGEIGERLDRHEHNFEALEGYMMGEMEQVKATLQETQVLQTEDSQRLDKVIETLANIQAQFEELKESLDATDRDWAIYKKAMASRGFVCGLATVTDLKMIDDLQFELDEMGLRLVAVQFFASATKAKSTEAVAFLSILASELDFLVWK